MNPGPFLSPRTFLHQTQQSLWRCRTPLPFHPQPWPSAELCRRGSCNTLIRGGSNNTEQLSRNTEQLSRDTAAEQPRESIPRLPRNPCAPPGTMAAEARPGLPGLAAPLAHGAVGPEPPGKLRQLRGVTARAPRPPGATKAQGLRCDHRHSRMGAEARPPLLLLLLFLARRFLAAPRPGGSQPLPAGPVAPHLHPPARPRTQRPPLAQPGSPTASTGCSAISCSGPDGAPRGCSAGDARPRAGCRGGRGDTRTQTRLWRSCARPPSPGPAVRGPGRFSSAAARPSRPHALRAALTHRGRTERVPARTERGGRRRAQSPQRLPRPPPAPSPLYPTGAERHRLQPINARRHIATRRGLATTGRSPFLPSHSGRGAPAPPARTGGLARSGCGGRSQWERGSRCCRQWERGSRGCTTNTARALKGAAPPAGMRAGCAAPGLPGFGVTAQGKGRLRSLAHGCAVFPSFPAQVITAR